MWLKSVVLSLQQIKHKSDANSDANISNQHPYLLTPHPTLKKIKYIKRIYIKQDVYFQHFIKTFTNTDGDTVHLNITFIVTLVYKLKAWNDVTTKLKKKKKQERKRFTHSRRNLVALIRQLETDQSTHPVKSCKRNMFSSGWQLRLIMVIWKCKWLLVQSSTCVFIYLNADRT